MGAVRAKLNRTLGQEKNQESNPFQVGEQIIITLQPQEISNKLMARWKGPFTVTKIPNRFQVEYKERGMKKITHISYAKKFFARHFRIKTVSQSDSSSCHLDLLRMSRLHISFGNRQRRLVSSVEKIRSLGCFGAGRVRICVCGRKEDLSEELKAISVRQDLKGSSMAGS